MNIQTAQNERTTILKIAAARRLYSKAKQYNNFYMMLNVVLITTLAIFSIGLNSDFFAQRFGFEKVDISIWVAVASIAVLSINKLVIGSGIDSNRETAAKIQELMDRDLFKLSWNSALAGNKPRFEEITKNGEWYLSKYGSSALENWYALNSTRISHYHQVLICQNSSLYWDVSLRKKTNSFIIWGGVCIFTVALVASLYLNLPMQAVLINLVALLGPMLDYGYTSLKENKDSIVQSERLLECISSTIEQAESGASEVELQRLTERVQDQIFSKRKSNWLIPDMFYRFFRNQDEVLMTQSSAQLEERFETLGV